MHNCCPKHRTHTRPYPPSLRTLQSRGNPNGQWQHDLNQDAPARGNANANMARGGTKIMISNLNPNIVKDEDMRVRRRACVE